MSSQHEVLKFAQGVTLKKVTLPGPSGPLAVAYSISSRRTPEVWQTGDRAEAERLFQEELARCNALPLR